MRNRLSSGRFSIRRIIASLLVTNWCNNEKSAETREFPNFTSKILLNIQCAIKSQKSLALPVCGMRKKIIKGFYKSTFVVLWSRRDLEMLPCPDDDKWARREKEQFILVMRHVLFMKHRKKKTPEYKERSGIAWKYWKIISHSKRDYLILLPTMTIDDNFDKRPASAVVSLVYVFPRIWYSLWF